MGDTNKALALLTVFTKNSVLSSSEVARIAPEKQSLVTVKRQLGQLTKVGYLEQSGAGRSVRYRLSKKGRLLRPFNTAEYLKKDPDARLQDTFFQFDVFTPPYIALFTDAELEQLDAATETFRRGAADSDPTVRSKELMRFIIEFSWKSSQIEGNTYDLISTERLLRYGEKSPANTEYEAQMILNQKDALEFILQNNALWSSPSVALLEKLHGYVGKNLGITPGLRQSSIGIAGTSYRPLENAYQIREALDMLFAWISATDSSYEKALLSVLGLSYIQPFVDGNKRTSRLFANALLLTQNHAPLSYRSANDREYKETTVLFYEQNTVEPFKKLFIEQYIFAAHNYNIANPS